MLIGRAFRFARSVHEGQTRRSGEPYIIHPFEVALLLASGGMDAETIAAGLLHDVIEDCGVTEQEITDGFSPTIAAIVDGVTKIGRYRLSRPDQHQILNFRKMILAMVEDPRVIFVKLADRLHNMRTLDSLGEDSRTRIARETLHIYAPIAHRLGAWRMMAELEDLAFSRLQPDRYRKIVKDLKAVQPRAARFMERTRRRIRRILARNGIDAPVSSRMKHVYSIAVKMERKGYDFDRLYDIQAFRILTESEEQCYHVLGVLHSAWTTMEGRYKDYIRLPKSNGYRSLHTTLISEDGRPFEVQIRTREMHQVAEEGMAAHLIYKSGPSERRLQHELVWMRRLSEVARSATTMEEIGASLKRQDVYVLTPGGDVVSLRRGATALDFAYRIHTDLGHRTTGALVNGRMVPLATKLRTGDRVQILTHPRQTPSADWLTILGTASAKMKVRRFLRKERAERMIAEGKKILRRYVRGSDAGIRKILRDPAFAELLAGRGWAGVDELYRAVGEGKVTIETLMAPWIPIGPEKADESISPGIGSGESSVVVGGESDIAVRFARCCFPVPGDPIGAVVTRTRGMVIHRTFCPGFRGEAVCDARWVGPAGAAHPLKFHIVVREDASFRESLKRECDGMGVRLTEMKMRSIGAGRYLVSAIVVISHVRTYRSLRTRLGAYRAVESVTREGELAGRVRQRSS